jgi:hypothetical protein
MNHLQVLAAIEALLDGKYDDAALRGIGPLSVDLRTNINAILDLKTDPLAGMDRDMKNAIMCRMQREGTGFSSRLADAYLCADSGNRARIEREFSHLFELFKDPS